MEPGRQAVEPAPEGAPPSAPAGLQRAAPVSDRPLVDLDRLEAQLDELAPRYRDARPYPHIVLEDFLAPETLARAIEEFPSLDPERWNHYVHANERKFSHTDPATWGPTLQAVLAECNSPRFVNFVSRHTGVPELIPDPSLEGGGLHQSTAGGFLNIHADYTVHPHHAHWRRRANLLLYLNEDWRPEFGGDLELWSTDMKQCVEKIAPTANRVVIFTTDVDSFHGHPEPMRCPPDRARRSLALYYFTVEDHPLVRSTEYRARPGDGLHSVLIYADKQLLRAYDRAKRHFGISDQAVNALLRRLERLRRRRRQP
ncbi:MAG: 2OG-Fe(II) oxygenase [Acidimicrobiales bacterium]